MMNTMVNINSPDYTPTFLPPDVDSLLLWSLLVSYKIIPEDANLSTRDIELRIHDHIMERQFHEDVTNESIARWGPIGQVNQTQEECAELIVALNKHFRRDHNTVSEFDVASELADVEIMSACMRKIVSSGLIESEKRSKLERLATERLGMNGLHSYLRHR